MVYETFNEKLVFYNILIPVKDVSCKWIEAKLWSERYIIKNTKKEYYTQLHNISRSLSNAEKQYNKRTRGAMLAFSTGQDS